MSSDATSMSALLTYEDYCLIPDDGNRHEIIHGVHYMSPSPRCIHQQILGNLYYTLRHHLEDQHKGHIIMAPLDVILSDHDIVQPDLLFISNKREAILKEKNVQGLPDLAIEILSEGNRRHDEVRKRILYESAGISEYWIVDPEIEVIKIYRLEGGKYLRAAELRLEDGDELSTTLLPGFSCPLEKVFA